MKWTTKKPTGPIVYRPYYKSTSTETVVLTLCTLKDIANAAPRFSQVEEPTDD